MDGSVAYPEAVSLAVGLQVDGDAIDGPVADAVVVHLWGIVWLALRQAGCFQFLDPVVFQITGYSEAAENGCQQNAEDRDP